MPAVWGYARVSREDQALALQLDALEAAGWQLPDAQGNFVWLPLGDRTGDFAAAAEERGVMVRPFAGEGARVRGDSPSPFGGDVSVCRHRKVTDYPRRARAQSKPLAFNER